MQCLGKLFQVLIEFVRNAFPIAFVKAFYERSNEQPLWYSTMYLTFHQVKLGKKYWLRKLFQVLIRFISQVFPEWLFWRALQKEQGATPFAEQHIGVSGGNLQIFKDCYCWVATFEIGCNILWNIFIKMCYLYSINVPFTNFLSIFYLGEGNIYRGLFFFIYKHTIQNAGI